MTVHPHSKSGDFGDRIYRAFDSGICEHSVRSHVHHAVSTYPDFAACTVVPAVTFDQSDAIGAAFSHPVLTNEIHIIRDLAAENSGSVLQ